MKDINNVSAEQPISKVLPRCGRIKTFLQNYKKSTKAYKLSCFLPYLILFLELLLLIDATIIDFNLIIIIITLILVTISIVEIVLVTMEINDKIKNSNFEKILTIRLDDFITKKREKNVKIIITDFLEQYPEFYKHRNKIYHIACKILELHQKEALNKDVCN